MSNSIKVCQDTCGKIAAFVRQPPAASSETSFPLLSLFAKFLLMHFARSYLADHLLLATLDNKCANYGNQLLKINQSLLGLQHGQHFPSCLQMVPALILFCVDFSSLIVPLSNFHEKLQKNENKTVFYGKNESTNVAAC